MTTRLRTLIALTSVSAALLAGARSGLAAAQLPPGVTLPPRASDTTVPPPTTTPPETTAPATIPQSAPTTEPGQVRIQPVGPVTPAVTAPPTTAPETKIILLPPREETRIVPGPAPDRVPAPGPVPGAAEVEPPRLDPGQVDRLLRSRDRTGASTTGALVRALEPLTALGMTQAEALALGMGRLPLLGVANWTDDWLDFRAGPPPHQHMGNDLFAAFDVPVRAPSAGVVRFEDAGLGGKAATVTAPDGTYYFMAHLSGFAPDLRSGAAVEQGRVVGFNGDSGNARGGAPHVHFEVHPGGGAAVNPKPILDAWLAEALAAAPALVASFLPAVSREAGDGRLPQILVSTGLTRRFSTPPPLGPARTPADFGRAVLRPLTPAALAALLDRSPSAGGP